METYRVVGMSANSDVGDGTIPNLLYCRVFECRTARVLGVIDDIRDAVDESDHCVFQVPDMITEPQTNWWDA